MFPRTGILLSGIGLLTAGVAPLVAQTSSPASVPMAAQAAATTDYAQLETRLTEAVRQAADPTVKDAQFLHTAMLLELIRTTGAGVMNGFAAQSPEKAAFLSAFTADAEWLETYLSAGLVPYQTEVGLDVLFRIWQSEKGEVKNKPLACACASVWGGGETWQKPNILTTDPAHHNPVWRYNYFQEKAALGVLHPNYKNLKTWELRFVVGIPQQDWEDESYTWTFENINLPWDQYGNACWAGEYTDPSKFGDNVQSGEYHFPYADVSWAQATHLNGGVCGSLSRLGAVAAMAHGIPAYAVGQPGHCAYAYRLERGKWLGGFGGPDGNMHNYIFGKSAPTSYRLMEAVFGDDAAIAAAYRESFAADALAAAGRTDDAVAAWHRALKLSPKHPFFRASLHKIFLAQGMSPAACYEYLKKALPVYDNQGMSSIDMAADLMPLIAKMTDAQKTELFFIMHRNLAHTNVAWAVNDPAFTAPQMATLSSDAAREKFLGDVFAIHMAEGDGTVFGLLLEWAVKEYVEQGKTDFFGRAFAAAANSGKSAAGSADDEKKAKMAEAYGKAIIAAEQAKSVPAFRTLTQSAMAALKPVNKEKGQLANPAAVPGKVAACSLFRLSSNDRIDTPVLHPALMTPQGGFCCTRRETKPTMIADLEQSATLTGCIIRKASFNQDRMKKATVYTSADGATWFPRATTDNMPEEWAVTFPVDTYGKHVKVEFDNGRTADFAHITHFVIFTK